MGSSITILVGLLVSVVLVITFWLIGYQQKRKSSIRVEIANQKAEIINNIEEATGDVLKSKSGQRDTLSHAYYKSGFPVWSKWLIGLAFVPFLASVIIWGAQRWTDKSSTNSSSTTYALSASVNPSGGGSINLSGGNYASGSTLNLTATPASGYQFSFWGGDASSSSPSISLTMDSNKNVIANFSAISRPLYSLSASANPPGGGSINLSGGNYASGSTLNLTATPASGYQFSFWGGDAPSSSPSISLTMDSNKNVIANFSAISIPSYSLSASVNPSGGGSINLSGGNYASGSTLNLTATPASGYQFSFWGGDASSSSPSISLTMDSNKNVIANFSAISRPLYSLSASANPPGGGSINPSGGNYASGSTVTLTATAANSGYQFSSWSGDASGSSPSISITMNSNKNITANFSATQVFFNLTTSVSPPGSGSGSINPSGGNYASGSTVTLTATAANSGYQFSSWSGDASGSSPSISITMNSNKNITANFSATQVFFNLTTSVSPPGSGSVSINPSGGSYASGSNVILTATLASSSYQFSSWSGDASGSSPSISVIVNSNKNIIANFSPSVPQKIVYTLPSSLVFFNSSGSSKNNLAAGQEIKGTVSLSGNSPYGELNSNLWSFEIDDPNGKVVYSKNYTFISAYVDNFDFVTTIAGNWNIKVTDASTNIRTVQINILPTGWQ